MRIVDDRERGWFHLDNAVIDEYLPKIGATAFAVYACIVRHSDRQRNAFPSYTLLQKELGCGRSQIAAAIKKIVDAGLVTITIGKRASNCYHVVNVSTSPIPELVPIQDQSRSETGTSSDLRPELVPNRDSNNTQLTRPKEQDPVGGARARASRIPDDFPLTPELCAYAASKQVSREQAEAMHERFVLYWQAASGANAVKTSWVKAWQGWLLRDLQDGKIGATARAPNGRASPNGQYQTAQEKTQNAIGRYAERIRRNGNAENDERSPTIRAHLADRSVPLDDG